MRQINLKHEDFNPQFFYGGIMLFSLMLEMSKIGLVCQFLTDLKNNCLIVKQPNKMVSHSIFERFQQMLNPIPLSKDQISIHVVKQPLYEEFIFRICVQGGIFLIQRSKNKNRECSQIELRKQKIFRISVTAFLFGFSHFIYQPLSARQIKNVAWICLTGIVYGYLTENRRSISESYLIHGMNNALCCAKMLHPQKRAMLQSVIYLSYLGLLALFSKEIYSDLKSIQP